MYKWDAEDYHRNSFNQQTWAQDAIAKIDFRGDERVLDIGCGDGKITAEIATYLPNGSILGIDISEEMIKFAQSKILMSSFSNLKFHSVDATKLNFEDEFDIIVSFSCLHWIKDHIPILKGIKRSLKTSGRVFLEFGGKRGTINPIKIAINEVISNIQWSEYFKGFEGLNSGKRFYSSDEYKDMLTSVGLKVKRVALVPKDMIAQGKEGLEAWVRTTGVPDYLNRVPESLRQTLINEIVDKYIEKYPLDITGLIRVSMMRLEVEAIKAETF
jgi:trans-aconitate 2-methyltransferase